MNAMPRIRTLSPEGEAHEFALQADYFNGHIDLKAFCAANPHYPVLSTSPMVLEPQKGSYVYLSRFGGVVFWNCPEALIRQLHEELKALPNLEGVEEQTRDFLRVKVGAAEDSVGFSEVHLREFTLEKLGIVSLALAQSVALDHFEGAVSRVMARVQPVVEVLAREGRMTLPHREVLRFVGFAMEVRATVMNNLTLFDDPPETWESEALAHLDSALFDQFDLEERLGAIREKLAYLQDAGTTFRGLLDTRKDQRLEWIIILLILVEILMSLGKELPKVLGKLLG